ncbi:MAG TPA: UDP-N-acetylglucosamine 2-epimerase (non-hydrolyzing) [Gemmatimonadales bacterium]|nr:UDP-N-acetylglucosamine 2-epimerase (non-hydrolyzing) [Gemmatimonadales bacterium]
MTPSILSVVGARPNFMKLAPVARALAARGARHVVVHTGQHYDPEMSDAFFRDLDLPRPDHALGVGSASHARQTAAILERLEPVCQAEAPDVVLVYGDVNSTVAAALVATKLGHPVGHVEAGLRSRDRSMPEEVNRVITDHVADVLFAPSRDAVDNLRHEGVAAERVHFVGNVMIDSLVAALPVARALDAPRRHDLGVGEYTVVTLHRPANVDDPATLCELLGALTLVGADGPVVFPVHPRTRARIRDLGVNGGSALTRLVEPLPYLEMLGLVADAALVITDSGGLQEETTWLGVPCVTVRPNTERPITCSAGTNRLVAPRREAIRDAARAARAARVAAPPVLERWDGSTGERIAAVLCEGARFA